MKSDVILDLDIFRDSSATDRTIKVAIVEFDLLDKNRDKNDHWQRYFESGHMDSTDTDR